tara:strand:- start:74 stop:772 length:699 start_codon:yes stop_codon:yes gene_type:complete
MNQKNKVIVAIDLDNFEEIIKLIDRIKNSIFGIKLGYEFLFNFGIDGYKKIQDKKINIFLDLKLHDIPNTVKKGLDAIFKLEPYFTTLHLSGGDKMFQDLQINRQKTKLLGITALTSLDNEQVKKYYKRESINELVHEYSKYALENKLDGIVCSANEISIVKKIIGNNLIIVTPGIRPTSYKLKDDQERTMEPKKAISLGADYLVIGRPIIQAKNPLEELNNINSEINEIKN